MVPSTPNFAAFFSYSRQNKRLAQWLVRELEGLRPPREIVDELRVQGAPFTSVRPIFRDEQDMPVGGVVPERLPEVLDASATMIVLCTPAAAQSNWVNTEIRVFAERHPERRIIAVVAEGDPDTDDCYPPALRAAGKPLAADLRPAHDRRKVVVKIAAAVLGVDVDRLVQRMRKQAAEQRRWIAVGASAGLALVIGLGATAMMMSARAGQADDLARANVEKLLTDTRKKMDTLAQLEANAAVHDAAKLYFDGKAGRRLNDDDLLLKAQWLQQEGADALQRGEDEKALSVRNDAFAATAELLQRNPSNPEFLFWHGQSAFSLGEYFYSSNDLKAAQAPWRTYEATAQNLVKVAPAYANRTLESTAPEEIAYARTNLGVLALEEDRDARTAATLFLSAIAILEPNAGNLQSKENLSRAYKQYIEALAQFALVDEVLNGVNAWEKVLLDLDAMSAQHRDLNSDLATNWRVVAEFRRQAGQKTEADRAWRRTREIVDNELGQDPANTRWLKNAERVDASMGIARNCDEVSGAIDFSNDVSARVAEICLSRLKRDTQLDLCSRFAASLSPASGTARTPRPSARLIQERAWAGLLVACGRSRAATDQDLAAKLNTIAKDRFFSRDFHQLRLRTQIKMGDFASADPWVADLKSDLKKRGWKGD